MYDVIVIGARVAGASTAMLLARKGHRVLLVDRDEFPSDVLSTHFLWPRGASYLNRWGVLDKVLETTPSGERIDLVIEGVRLSGQVPLALLQERFARTHGGDGAGAVTSYLSVRRRVLDQALLEAAAAAGAEVRTGFEFEGLLFDGPGRVVGVRGRTAEGRHVEERARAVVGADGRRSSVARALGLATFEERPKCTFAYFSYFSGFDLGSAQIHKRGRLSLGVVPTNFGANMTLVFGPAEWFAAFARDREANYFKALRYVSPEIADVVQGQGRREEKFYGATDLVAFWRKASGPGWALVGDAGCFKDQCTAMGMTHALRDAELAADALDRGLSGAEPLDRALHGYARRRYLDGIDYYNFVAAQAEMSPTRLDELALFEALADDPAQAQRFLAVYGDTLPVRAFMSSRNVNQILAGRPPEPGPRYAEHERALDRQYENLFEGRPGAETVALSRTTLDFMKPPTRDLLARTEPYGRWLRARSEAQTWPYTRFLHAAPGPTAPISDEQGHSVTGVNFASQDYLGLAADPRVHEAAARALREFGPHSAGSPVVLGNTTLSTLLERELGELLGMEHVLLFPTGWAAGYGSIAGLVRPDDHVLLDRYAHACLQAGARAATRRVERHAHLDLDAARYYLEDIRARDARNGILVVTEGLFSMDSDFPDLRKLQALCREFDATLLVDVAHDLGSMGERGTGLLGRQGVLGEVDLVMGSFSKTFASNGGFLAARSGAVTQYVKMFGGSHMFSNALSPVQTSVVRETLRIVRSSEGDALRESLFRAIDALRGALAEGKTPAIGQPSPIVPVVVGHEAVARRAYRNLFRRNVGANMLEFPVVASGAARFRLQVMASHTPEQGRAAGIAVAESIREAREASPPAANPFELPSEPPALAQTLLRLGRRHRRRATRPFRCHRKMFRAADRAPPAAAHAAACRSSGNAFLGPARSRGSAPARKRRPAPKDPG